MGINSFDDLGLIEPLRKALREQKYEIPTPIQVDTIPHILLGCDIIGCAQTGTGKTAAFALPILQLLSRSTRNITSKTTRVLVLTPTRELASQIDESFRTYGRHTRQTHAVVFGGVGQDKQVKAMAKGVDILIATPGRLLDLMNQGHIKLDKVEIFVLDEADRMLDMGFIRDIRKVIAKLPPKRQSLFFSATMAPEIIALSNTILNDPVQVSVTPEQPTVELIEQSVMFVDGDKKGQLLKKVIIDEDAQRVLVFTRTKHRADKVATHLTNAGIIAKAIHGNKSQSAREHALRTFKSGKTHVLVATDIAARGIDVDEITHVINFELPDEVESYVHRIGRTARAGASGIAISLCEAQERDLLRSIETFIKRKINVVEDHPFHSQRAQDAVGSNARRPPRGGQGRGQARGGRSRKQEPNKRIPKRDQKRRYHK